MPVGDSKIDEDRYKNLQAMVDLVDKLLFDIGTVVPNKDRLEASMRKSGKLAEDFFDALEKEIDVKE